MTLTLAFPRPMRRLVLLDDPQMLFAQCQSDCILFGLPGWMWRLWNLVCTHLQTLLPPSLVSRQITKQQTKPLWCCRNSALSHSAAAAARVVAALDPAGPQLRRHLAVLRATLEANQV